MRASYIRRYNAILGVITGALGVSLGVGNALVPDGGPYFGLDGNILVLIFLVLICSLSGKEIAKSIALRKFHEEIIPQKREIYERLKRYLISDSGYTPEEIKQKIPERNLAHLLDIFSIPTKDASGFKERFELLRPFFEGEKE